MQKDCASLVRVQHRDRLKAEEGKTNGGTSGDGGGGLSAVWEMSGPTYVVAHSFRRICA